MVWRSNSICCTYINLLQLDLDKGIVWLANNANNGSDLDQRAQIRQLKENLVLAQRALTTGGQRPPYTCYHDFSDFCSHVSGRSRMRPRATVPPPFSREVETVETSFALQYVANPNISPLS